MFKKTALAAVALATLVAAQPISSANASQIDFSVTIAGPNGSITFGNGGGYYPQPSSMSCWEARQYLKSEFKKVDKIECNGDVYTFKVKKFLVSPWKTLKLNSDNGAWWFV